MPTDLRPQLLISHIYDMSMVSRIHGLISDLVQDSRSFPSSRLFALVFYFSLCRLMHPTGCTLGEELVECIPSGLNESYRPYRNRIKWLLSTVSLPAVLGIIIPYIARKTRIQTVETILSSVTLLLSDVWFFLNPKATALSTIEATLRPRDCHPVRLRSDDHISFPSKLFPAVGFVSLLRIINELNKLRGTHVQGSEHSEMEPTEEEDRLKDICSICMSQTKRPTSTLCGHVFCWGCISEWTGAEGNHCPSCRIMSQPQDLLPLVNYSSTDIKPFWAKPIFRNSDS